MKAKRRPHTLTAQTKPDQPGPARAITEENIVVAPESHEETEEEPLQEPSRSLPQSFGTSNGTDLSRSTPLAPDNSEVGRTTQENGKLSFSSKDHDEGTASEFTAAHGEVRSPSVSTVLGDDDGSKGNEFTTGSVTDPNPSGSMNDSSSKDRKSGKMERRRRKLLMAWLEELPEVFSTVEEVRRDSVSIDESLLEDYAGVRSYSTFQA